MKALPISDFQLPIWLLAEGTRSRRKLGLDVATLKSAIVDWSASVLACNEREARTERTNQDGKLAIGNI
jgi:hypothetical protein